MTNEPSLPDRPSSVCLGAVAKHEAVLAELVGDGQDGGAQPGVLARQEPEYRCQKRRRIEGVALIVLAQHAALVHPALEDVRLDLGGGLRPGRGEVGVAADVRELRGAVERHPAHQLRRYVVPRLAARLPDALVGVLPDRRGALGLCLHERPQPPRDPLAAAAVQQDRVERRAVDVVLALVEGAVADAYGIGAVVSRKGPRAPIRSGLADRRSRT